MTALSEFTRLEAIALWRPDKEAQRQEVIVSIGDATLTLSTNAGMALAHWSLPALILITDSGARPARYKPSDDSYEEIELDDELMIEAITRIQTALARKGPKPGRLRRLLYGSSFAGLVAFGVFWLPPALIDTAVESLPPASRAQIGEALLERIERLAGQPCTTPFGLNALGELQMRLSSEEGRIVVLPSGVEETKSLPGGITLISHNLVEDYESVEVTAGYVLAEHTRRAATDPLRDILDNSGMFATAQLLATGALPEAALDDYAETLLTSPSAPLEDSALIARFAQAEISPKAYAYARDITGVSVLPLLEAAQVNVTFTRPILDDSDWVALQSICLK